MHIFSHMIDADLKNEDRNPSDDRVPKIVGHDHQANTNEGGEFLDDAIRLADQPFYAPDNT